MSVCCGCSSACWRRPRCGGLACALPSFKLVFRFALGAAGKAGQGSREGRAGQAEKGELGSIGGRAGQAGGAAGAPDKLRNVLTMPRV